MRREMQHLALAVAGVVLIGGVGLGVYVERREREEAAWRHAARLTGGSPEAGLKAIARYGCGACHQIPGAPGAAGQVGPPLTGVGARAYIAGRFANDPPTLIRWIREPQAMAPGVAMPDMGVDEQAGRDIAAYLYTLG
jgi:cytochrome c2